MVQQNESMKVCEVSFIQCLKQILEFVFRQQKRGTKSVVSSRHDSRSPVRGDWNIFRDRWELDTISTSRKNILKILTRKRQICGCNCVKKHKDCEIFLFPDFFYSTWHFWWLLLFKLKPEKGSLSHRQEGSPHTRFLLLLNRVDSPTKTPSLKSLHNLSFLCHF